MSNNSNLTASQKKRRRRKKRMQEKKSQEKAQQSSPGKGGEPKADPKDIPNDTATEPLNEDIGDDGGVLKKGKGEKKNKAVGISKQFPKEDYPKGEILPFDGSNKWRSTDEEKIKMDSFYEDKVKDLRRAAEAHRQLRMWAKEYIKPGMCMFDIAETVEDRARILIDEDGLNSGIAFPTGVSLNECAAHYTPNKGDDIILKKDDVMKLDIGLHVNGHIIDSAITLHWNDIYNPVVNASKDATNTACKLAGADVLINDISEAINEVITSYEVEIDGKTIPVLPIANLTGHSLGEYIIHSGKSVPLVPSKGETTRMMEGELFALETFASTGKGRVVDDGECSHYMRAPNYRASLRSPKAKHLLRVIEKQFGTLAWCRRWLDRIGEEKYLLALKNLVDAGLVREYPPLSDKKGCVVSQWEHTLILKSSCKEILSRGDDF